jgi:hypothetical protein
MGYFDFADLSVNNVNQDDQYVKGHSVARVGGSMTVFRLTTVGGESTLETSVVYVRFSFFDFPFTIKLL